MTMRCFTDITRCMIIGGSMVRLKAVAVFAFVFVISSQVVNLISRSAFAGGERVSACENMFNPGAIGIGNDPGEKYVNPNVNTHHGDWLLTDAALRSSTAAIHKHTAPTIDRSHPVPGGVWYGENEFAIDPKFPLTFTLRDGRVAKYEPFIMVQAAIERAHVHDGMPVRLARTFGLAVEREAVHAAGIDVREYYDHLRADLAPFQIPVKDVGTLKKELAALEKNAGQDGDSLVGSLVEADIKLAIESAAADRFNLVEDNILEALDWITKRVAIDARTNVPYVAGYSTIDPNLVYIDKRVPQFFTTSDGVVVPVWQTLALHEAHEATLIKKLGLFYQDSHQTALRLERLKVRARITQLRRQRDKDLLAGTVMPVTKEDFRVVEQGFAPVRDYLVNPYWKEYNDFFRRVIDDVDHHSRAADGDGVVAPDLMLTPYVDEDDEDLVRSMAKCTRPIPDSLPGLVIPVGADKNRIYPVSPGN